jgi:uncharacterized membrane protein YphA (DoxX/SURF4 family)
MPASHARTSLPGPRSRLILYHAARILMGIVFLYASYDKILKPQAFAQAVFNYQILPDSAVNIAALVLPWLELLLGLCLLAGFWLPGATMLSTGLLAVFIGALVFNQVRGLDVHCGCFSTESSAGPAGVWTVARDLLFFSVSIYLALSVLFARSWVPSRRRAGHSKDDRRGGR